MKKFYFIKTNNSTYGIYEDIEKKELQQKIKKNQFILVKKLHITEPNELTEVEFDLLCKNIISIEENKEGTKYMEELDLVNEKKEEIIRNLQGKNLKFTFKLWLFYNYKIFNFNNYEVYELSLKDLKIILKKLNN